MKTGYFLAVMTVVGTLVPFPAVCENAVITVIPNLEAEWEVQFADLQDQMSDVRRAWFKSVADQSYRNDALILQADKTPAQVIMRRTDALLADLAGDISPSKREAFQEDLNNLRGYAGKTDLTIQDQLGLFKEICRLRRQIVFSNPLLDFDKIIFIKGHYAVNHCCDQYFGFNAKPGGGMCVLFNPFSDNPQLTDVLADSTVQRGRLKGQKLTTGSFRSLSLSYDGSTAFFAYTQCDKAGARWSKEQSWHIFKASVDGTGLEQITDGTWNDFDPCLLPNGRLVFISERRSGFGRCHGRPVPTYTLHSMRRDGTDIVPLSYHETNEWHPSVNNDGMIVYTRWDYVDRGDCIAHHPWITFPDGRDPRVIQGNYPVERNRRPDMEMHVRAIPGSHKYVATAAGHHMQAYGSLVLVDPWVEDDGAMSAVKRLTPEMPFPEVEKGSHTYGTAWPLSEDHYLCVYTPMGRGRLGIYIVDTFGNKELLYRDESINCIHPIPLRRRTTPPVIPHATATGRPDIASERGASGKAIPTTGTVACMNVYAGLKPWPEGTKITALRVVQLFPKSTFSIDRPRIGIAAESLARGVLGTVPVEEDGSAHFTVPAGKTIYFQALDENGCAVQSMMSDTYVHPGEKLTCMGCHEPAQAAPVQPSGILQALRREPSELEPDVDGSYPMSFARLVQPVLNEYCVGCHRENKEKNAPDLSGEPLGNSGWSRSYGILSRYAYGSSGKPPGRQPVRTTPGEFGARASKLYEMIMKGHAGFKISDEALHRIIVWLDLNSNFLGAYEEVEAQLMGERVMPKIE